jgi:hypothetical protein
MKSTLNPPGIKGLKRKCDVLLSNFAFKINLRRYKTVFYECPQCGYTFSQNN